MCFFFMKLSPLLPTAAVESNYPDNEGVERRISSGAMASGGR
jgi:hypothetical protein